MGSDDGQSAGTGSPGVAAAAAEVRSTEPVVTIGRIVHYRPLDGEPVPAIVVRTRRDSTVVDLQVFHYNRGVELQTLVEQGDSTTTHAWHWPPRD